MVREQNFEFLQHLICDSKVSVAQVVLRVHLLDAKSSSEISNSKKFFFDGVKWWYPKLTMSFLAPIGSG